MKRKKQKVYALKGENKVTSLFDRLVCHCQRKQKFSLTFLSHELSFFSDIFDLTVHKVGCFIEENCLDRSLKLEQSQARFPLFSPTSMTKFSASHESVKSKKRKRESGQQQQIQVSDNVFRYGQCPRDLVSF